KEYPELELGAAQALAQIGKPARAAIPALLEAAGKCSKSPMDEDENDLTKARVAQIEALEKLGADNQEVVATIRRVLKTADSWFIRRQAMTSFLKLENNSERIVLAMSEELERRTSDGTGKEGGSIKAALMRDAIIALGKQGSRAKSAVPVLVKSYQS